MPLSFRAPLQLPRRAFLARVVRHGYPLVMLVGFNGLALHLAPRPHATLAMLALLACAIATSFVAERLLPYDASWNDDHGDTRRDWLHFVVNEVANLVSVGALPFVARLVHSPFAGAWPSRWPFVAQVLVAILVFDLGVTLTHWASHRVDVLWRFHAVHHSVKRFYGFNGLMKHPIHQAIEMVVAVTPLVLVGLPPSVASALAFCTAIQLLMQHSNVDYSVSWRVFGLERLLALNAGHRFHHQKWPGIGDVNFGLFTTLGDRLLGTWTFDPARVFTSDDLGIGKEPDYPVAYVAQLRAPFRSGRQIS